ncbi:transporter [Rufibacter glacialis]|uniref:oligosaccharide flippase family protein n=1 Tax=Rufibacter glacialis TaxID=1259555 RepID=UPI001665B26F|nr:oligosaccharide flippase family protein [Rufibacter glacialis]GGK70810.1 transporter [Rufibacter glacialis]
MLKNKRNSKDFIGGRVLKNLASLGSLQLLNFLIPLVLSPYLVRVIGLENFGRVAVAQALISYFNILTDYGFYITATKHISQNRDNKAVIETLYSEVLTTKLVLLGFSFLLLLGLVPLLSPPETNPLLYLLSFTLVLGQAAFPIWLFHGLEDMKYITIVNTLSKVVSVILIVLFVTSPADYIYINFFLGLGTMLAAAISLVFIKKKYGLGYRPVTLQRVKHHLREGKDIFISNFAVNLYSNSNILILGLFASVEVVGFYSVAEKIINAVRQLLGVYFQAIYPSMCNLVAKTKQEILDVTLRLHVPFSLAILFLCGAIYFFSEELTLYFSGTSAPEIIYLIKVLSFVPFIVALNIPSNQFLLIFGYTESYRTTLLLGSLLNLLLNTVLSYFYLAQGTAVAVMITEVFITAGLIAVLESKNPVFGLLFTKRPVNQS